MVKKLYMESNTETISVEVAGLITQNYLKSLVSTIKCYNNRRLIETCQLWKLKTLIVPRERQANIKNSLQAVHNQVNLFKKILQAKIKTISQDILLSILSKSKQNRLESSLVKAENELNAECQQELQILNKDLLKLQGLSAELEKKLKVLKSRELSFKEKIQEISNKKLDILNDRKKLAKEKEEEVLEQIEELKEENSGFKEKIEMIENNVNNFLGEMGGFMEMNEENQRVKERRRTSVKKVK